MGRAESGTRLVPADFPQACYGVSQASHFDLCPELAQELPLLLNQVELFALVDSSSYIGVYKYSSEMCSKGW